MRSWDGFGRAPGESDLFAYARQGNVAGLRRIFVPASTNLNEQDSFGNTPLLLAAQGGFAEAAEFLLDHGANPDLANHAGDTPLMGAAFRGQLTLVMMLIRFGADTELVNKKGLSAFGLASLFGRQEVAIYLAHRAPVRVA